MSRPTVRVTAAGRVTCTAVVDVPVSATAAWGQLRHLPTAAVHDPFHAAVVVHSDQSLTIEHRYVGVRVVRVGRVLWWREGVGFAFSDLHRTRPGAAFPHVMSYRLEAVDGARCRLHVRVGGRWTFGPPWVGRVWLWVFGPVVRTVRNDLLRYAVAMRRRAA